MPLRRSTMAFFHDGLDIGWAEKFTLDGVCLGYPEFTVLRYVILPWESLGLLKKFVECLGFYFAYFQKDAFCGAEEQIGVCHTLGVCLKSYSSVFHFGHFITKVQYFTFSTASVPKWQGAVNSHRFIK